MRFLSFALVTVALCLPSASAKESDGWTVLFDGSTTDHWRGYKKDSVPDGWVIEGDTLVRKTGGGDIVTKEQYDDFELELEWKVTPGANSGVMYRVAEEGGAPYLTGPEYQILDDSKHDDGKNPLTSAGSFYAMYPPASKATSPVGEWNKTKIIVHGNDVEHWLNDKLMVACTMWNKDWTARKNGSKFAAWKDFATKKKGHICLQDHGDVVAFRNIRIRPVSGIAATSEAVSSGAVAKKKTARILFVTQSKGFQHGAVNRKGGDRAHSETVMTELGVRSGLFRVDCTQDCEKDFTKERLQSYDIVMFYTTGKLPIDQETLDYFFNDWLKQPGHGFIGTHSAADTYKDYEPYWDMIGGSFDGHPWGSGSTVTITVHDTDHPVSKPWGKEFEIQDEIYKFKNWQPEKVHVLMSLNMEKTEKKAPYHVPVCWVKEYGKGKAMHMSLGHREDVWTNPTYQDSLLGGIRWIMGIETGDATPNPELSAEQEEKAKKDAA